jgi:AraC-like DNA-binding protein
MRAASRAAAAGSASSAVKVATCSLGQAVAAAGLLADPADGRTLAEWGGQVGASGRTLARAFLTGTGITFGRWRRLARLQAALPQLAAGRAVGTVARHVGCQTPSAFVAAFRKETGLTPALTSGRRPPGSGRMPTGWGRSTGSAQDEP